MLHHSVRLFHAGLPEGDNEQDGGNRRFILVEMVPDVARDVTAQRLQRVIKGYTNSKGEKIAPLGGGSRYCELGDTLFNSVGQIGSTITYQNLVPTIFFLLLRGNRYPRMLISQLPFSARLTALPSICSLTVFWEINR